MTDRAELVKRLRLEAHLYVASLKKMQEMRSADYKARGDADADYRCDLKPEDTHYWQAADLLHQDTGAAEAMREAAARLLDERVAAWSHGGDRLVPAEAVGSVCANAARAIRALPLPQPPVSDNTKERV